MMNEYSESLAKPAVTRADLASAQRAYVRELTAEQLFAGANNVAILHAGETYVLTRTKQNKLLLTKQDQALVLRTERPLSKE